MRFGVLGPLEVWTDEGTPVSVPGRRVRALLADLLLHAGDVVSSDRLIDDLWGDRLPVNPEGALQQNVSRLRRALEAGEPGAGRLVASRPGGYALRIGADAVDAGRFDALVSAARAHQARDSRAAALLREALALWRGTALAEFVGQQFARGETARLQERRLVALEDHIEVQLALGEHGSLIDILDTVVADHPLRERLRGLHMRALYRAGRQAEALDSYQRLRTHLARELGLDPSPELGRLYERILAQDPALDAPADAGVGVGPRTNVWAQLSSLVGRAEAIEHIRQLLSAHRLVTLTGPGGVGKTRVALETAAQMTRDLPDGTWVAELAGQAERPAPDLMVRVAEIVAETLGVRDARHSPSGTTTLRNISRLQRGVQEWCTVLPERIPELTSDPLCERYAAPRLTAAWKTRRSEAPTPPG